MVNRSFRAEANDINSFTPSYAGTNGSIATHSNLSATTAYSILKEDGGNAFDAAAGAMLVESLVNPQMFTMGGEGVMILKPHSKNPVVLNGNTKSPHNFNFLNLVTKGFREIPDQGILSAGVPSAFSSIFRLLQNYGKLNFRDIAKYAHQYAKEGFPIPNGIVNQNKFRLEMLKNGWINKFLLIMIVILISMHNFKIGLLSMILIFSLFLTDTYNEEGFMNYFENKI